MMAEFQSNRNPTFESQKVKQDTVGIDLKNITSQIRYNLWDAFRESMFSYLAEGTYSEKKFKDIIRSKGLRIPIKFPGDYGIDIDFNRPSPSDNIIDDYRITFKKEF